MLPDAIGRPQMLSDDIGCYRMLRDATGCYGMLRDAIALSLLLLLMMMKMMMKKSESRKGHRGDQPIPSLRSAHGAAPQIISADSEPEIPTLTYLYHINKAQQIYHDIL